MNMQGNKEKHYMVRHINRATIYCKSILLPILTLLYEKRSYTYARIYIRSACPILPERESGTDSKRQNLKNTY